MEQILKYLPLISAVILVGISWGSSQTQIDNLKEKVDARDNLIERQARIDERTQAILESQRRQEQMLQKLLDKALR